MLTIGQAARLLDVSVDTLRNWDESGKLPAVRDENDHRFYELEQINPLVIKRKQNMAIKQGLKLWQDLINQSCHWAIGVVVDINDDEEIVLTVYTKKREPEFLDGSIYDYAKMVDNIHDMNDHKIEYFNGYKVEYKERQ